ncbi:MAG: hypothetical protein DWQ37_08900 [Planctomycetota bacterium]|nr:MAG: hypothetical protein DWQ37_08900 [Planctomycetota bacterium]
MTNFQSLDALLKVRETERETVKLALSEAIRRQTQLEQRAMALEKALAEQHRLRPDVAGPGQLDLDRLRLASRYASELRRELAQLGTSRSNATATVTQCQHAIVAADCAVRTVEKLRDRRQCEQSRTETAREAKHLDEVATRSHSQLQRSC